MGIEHSQNYLHSKQLVATLLSKSNICNDDIVIEIGPGKGIITNELAKKSKKVIAIEFDAKLAKTLSERYKESKKVQIIEMDFLKYKISVKEPYKVCANIPFNITADIMKKVFEDDNPPEDIYFIMQYEAFIRYSGQPFYNESLRSLLYKPWFSAELIYEFKPSDFYPVPNARICFAHFQRKTSADVEDATDYRNFLSYIFFSTFFFSLLILSEIPDISIYGRPPDVLALLPEAVELPVCIVLRTMDSGYETCIRQWNVTARRYLLRSDPVFLLSGPVPEWKKSAFLYRDAADWNRVCLHLRFP